MLSMSVAAGCKERRIHNMFSTVLFFSRLLEILFTQMAINTQHELRVSQNQMTCQQQCMINEKSKSAKHVRFYQAKEMQSMPKL